MNQIKLPNGCSCSRLQVFPLNWNKAGASVDIDWYIRYRFYESGNDKPKQVVIKKGINQYKTLKTRRDAVQALMDEEMNMLLNDGANPITKTLVPPRAPSTSNEIEPGTPFLLACEMARLKLKCAEATKIDIKSCLGFVEKSAAQLNLNTLQISQVRRKHISRILDNCREVKKYWSPHLFNHYRSYLMMIFKKLIQLEAIESNPVDEHLEKETVETPARRTLSDSQVKRILEHFEDDKYYLRFIHIFFHSGARPVELLRLKYSDVDMESGIFKIKSRKGNKIREQQKPIKKVALQYWISLMGEAKPGEYLFGFGEGWARGFRNGLKPGPKPATRDFVTKKWNREVKVDEGLGIKVDLYSLKHKNLDEIAAYLSISEAQKAAGHKSPVITMVYATGEKKRQDERFASVPNALGG